jgi:hypothetical protein
VLEDTALESQGIACSFCHTLRGLGDTRHYVSAPETVRRYLGQGSSIVALRELGDLLIRWRPEAHRRDYHVPWLDGAAACAGCHRESYEGWLASPYAGHGAREASDEPPHGPDADDAVRCQDCHMAEEPRDARVLEPGRLVPWGATREQRRHHGFRGGNVRTSIVFSDDEGVRVDRGLRPGMITMRVTALRREGGEVHATVVLRNERVGHHFPTGEGGDARNVFLELETLDAHGERVLMTRAADHDAAKLGPRPGWSVPLVQEPKDARVPARQERAYDLVLPDGPGVVRVRASVRTDFDPAPLVTAEGTL